MRRVKNEGMKIVDEDEIVNEVEKDDLKMLIQDAMWICEGLTVTIELA